MNTRKIPSKLKVMIIATSTVLLLSLFAVMFSQPGLAATCKYKHKVQPGETLSSIAADYDVDWLEIAEANNLKEPYTLQVDQVLCIPGGTKPSDTITDDSETTEKTGTYLDAFVGLNSFLLEVNGLAKNTVYIVRVGNSPSNYLVNVGNFKTDKNGFYKGYFKLPTYIYLSTQRIQICAKNVWTDEIGCINVLNPTWNFFNPSCRLGPR